MTHPSTNPSGLLLTQDAWIDTWVTQDGSRMIRRARAEAGSSAATALRHEHALVERHRLDCMLPVEGLRSSGGPLELVYVNPGLERLLPPRPQNLDAVLALAEQVVRCLASVHDAGLILTNLGTSHLVQTHDRIFVLDFSRALAREREHQDIVSPYLLPTDVRTLAPEQSGRFNHPVDYRSDYYALGILLYEWLTGQLPFDDADPLSLLYAQLTRSPEPPSKHNPLLSGFIEGMVLKLLAKDPKRRYQSAAGIMADLSLARESLLGKSVLVAPGACDLPSTFQVSHRLYGREAERAVLLDRYEHACRGGQELVLISGYSGIGKTMLIRETYLPVTRQRAYFAAGKFDQLQHGSPYSAWVMALGRLLDVLLAEPPEQLAQWRRRLQSGLGRNGGALLALLPGLTHLLDPQPPVPELPASEASSRFANTVRDFLSVFCSPESPLVIFLDDLQWIDSASLNLLVFLSTDPGMKGLFLVGAYRDNEVHPSHPLSIALHALRHDAVFTLTELTLPPLGRDAVGSLLAATFSSTPDQLGQLVDAVQHRTGGNPLFIWQFLRTLRQRNTLFFDPDSRAWSWNPEGLRHAGFAENVVSLMLERFRDLPEATRTALSTAACLGMQFELKTLASTLDVGPEDLYLTLLPAVREEFILPDAPEETFRSMLVVHRFRFFHDRMQEAASLAISAEERKRIHHQSARRLLADTPDERLPDRIFEIVDHLRPVALELTTPEERLELARLTLLAARKAKASTAWSTALRYLRLGMEHLPEDLWEQHPDLAFNLYRERGELEYLDTNADAARAFVEAAIVHERSALKKAELYHLLVVQYTLRAIYPKAIALARQGLELFGLSLPETEFEAALDETLDRIRCLLAGCSLTTLGDLPPMVDPEQRSVMLLLTGMGPPCYRSHPRLWGLIVAWEVRICLEYGAVPSASYSFPAYGGLLMHVGQGSAETCRQLELATQTLLQRNPSGTDRSVGHLMVGSSLRHWFAPLALASQDYQLAYQTGLDSGNLQYAVYGFGHNAYCRFFQGVPLTELQRELETYQDLAHRRRNLWGVDLIEGLQHLVEVLTGVRSPGSGAETSRIPEPWWGDAEADYLSRCQAHTNLQVLCIYYILRAETCLHLEQHPRVLESLAEAGQRLPCVSTQGLLPAVQYHFLHALALSDQLTSGKSAQRPQDITLLESIHHRLIGWAEGSPANFGHMASLIRAERARVNGQWAEAADAYDQALAQARTQGMVQREALIATRCATFWNEREKPDFALIYRVRAREALQRWQADAVLRLRSSQEDPLLGSVSSPITLSEQDLQEAILTVQGIARHDSLEGLITAMVSFIQRRFAAQRVVLLVANPSLAVAHDTDADARQTPLPWAMLHYVFNSGKALVYASDSMDLPFHDPYLSQVQVRSALGLPLQNLGQTEAVLYLEHRDLENAFGPRHRSLLEWLSGQLAILLSNARLADTLRRQLEERERLLKHLQKRNAELLRLGDVMAHHFQEPARRLVSFVQRLQAHSDGRLDAEGKLALRFLDEQAHRLSALAHDAQRYLLQDQASVDAEAFCDSLQALMQVLTRLQEPLRGAELRIQKPLPSVGLSEPAMQELFFMLIDNACRYRLPGVVLKIEITCALAPARAYFTVADNGSGIPPGYREEVFGLFTRLVPNSRPGTGMGLALARKIVEQVDGQIRVGDGIQGGAAIHFDLPLRLT